MIEWHDTVVIGAGEAGLAMIYWLRAAGREHVPIARARVAARGRSAVFGVGDDARHLADVMGGDGG